MALQTCMALKTTTTMSTPGPFTFGSSRVERTRQGSESSDREFASTSYAITWKLQRRKGRVATLTEATVEDIEISPSRYLKDVLEPV